jgi:hypothetical protein
LKEPSPDFRVQALLLSRAGRYREAAGILDEARRQSVADDDSEAAANALLISSWLLIEQQQYARALDELAGAETMAGSLATGEGRSFLVLADLYAGIAEILAGNMVNALAREAAQSARRDGTNRAEANWAAALDGEIALAQGQYERAIERFKAAQSPVWLSLARDTLALFAPNPPSRDGVARAEAARGNRAGAIQEYKRLTGLGPGDTPASMLEPRHVLALARLLDQHGDAAGARVEYGRFLQLWAKADQTLPELAEARSALARLAPSRGRPRRRRPPSRSRHRGAGHPAIVKRRDIPTASAKNTRRGARRIERQGGPERSAATT